MTTLQTINAAANWNVRVNENFKAASPAAAFGIKDSTTTGLTLGYYGGILDGVSYSDGTHALTASTTRYVVAARATGVVSSATGTTNWNDSTNYLRMGVATVATSSFTWVDWRQVIGGSGGGGGGGSVAGTDKQIQFNDGGAFGAEAGFEYDKTTNTLTVDRATLNGLLLTLASASGGAGLRLPHGAAPTSPTNGDVWTTTAGVFVRVNGATVGPLSVGGGAADRTTVSAITPASGVANVDCSLGDYFTLAPTANVTSITFSNLPGSGKGASLMIRFTQDSTPRTVAWPASFKWEGGVAGAVSTGSGAIDIIAITTFDNGTTWQATISKARA